jgi:hypothetical protein
MTDPHCPYCGNPTADTPIHPWRPLRYHADLVAGAARKPVRRVIEIDLSPFPDGHCDEDGDAVTFSITDELRNTSGLVRIQISDEIQEQDAWRLLLKAISTLPDAYKEATQTKPEPVPF